MSLELLKDPLFAWCFCIAEIVTGYVLFCLFHMFWKKSS